MSIILSIFCLAWAYVLYSYNNKLNAQKKALDARESLVQYRERNMTHDFVNLIEQANPNRNHHNMGRRIQKIAEELGELNEAHLNVTSISNAKQKTWEDVREEAIDTAIVAMDVALTPFPNEHQVADPEDIKENVICVLRKKLYKWETNRKANTAATQTDDAV